MKFRCKPLVIDLTRPLTTLNFSLETRSFTDRREQERRRWRLTLWISSREGTAQMRRRTLIRFSKAYPGGSFLPSSWMIWVEKILRYLKLFNTALTTKKWL